MNGLSKQVISTIARQAVIDWSMGASMTTYADPACTAVYDQVFGCLAAIFDRRATRSEFRAALLSLQQEVSLVIELNDNPRFKHGYRCPCGLCRSEVNARRTLDKRVQRNY